MLSSPPGLRQRLHGKLRPYTGRTHASGVSAYAIGRDFIILEFRDEHAYLYTSRQPGRRHVAALKRLAPLGRGLATYINQHVRQNYDRQLW